MRWAKYGNAEGYCKPGSSREVSRSPLCRTERHLLSNDNLAGFAASAIVVRGDTSLSSLGRSVYGGGGAFGISATPPTR